MPLQGVAEAECRRAADAAEQAYNAAFSKAVGGDEATLNREHQRCMDLAQQAYADSAIGPLSFPSLSLLDYLSVLRHQDLRALMKDISDAFCCGEARVKSAEANRIKQIRGDFGYKGYICLDAFQVQDLHQH